MKGQFSAPVLYFFACMIIIIFLGIAFPYILKTGDLTNNAIQATNFSASDKQISQNIHDKQAGSMDGVIVFSFFCMWFSCLISAFFIDSHPVFFIVFLIVLIIIVVVLATVNNARDAIVSDSSISAYSSQFTLSNFLFDHWISTSIVAGFTIAIVLFGKLRSLVNI